MNRREFLSAGAGALAIGTTTLATAPAASSGSYRLTGPYRHKALAVYLIHRTGGGKGAVPLTLEEAMQAGVIQVLETGTVNRLVVRNPGDREVFIQAGDLVKGGKQDRVLAVSIVVPPNSGAIPIDAFCVEQGRWAKRAGESVFAFSESTGLFPSKAGALMMMGPKAGRLGMRFDSPEAQAQVWDLVRSVQRGLSRKTDRDVADVRSRSSLQLTLENDAVATALAEFETALGGLADKHPDAVGYVAAIGGTVDRGDEFESAALFRKLWSRQLRAVATEALTRRSSKPAALPTRDTAAAFIDRAHAAKTTSRKMAGGNRVVTGWTDLAAYAETLRGGGRWIHRRYVGTQ